MPENINENIKFPRDLELWTKIDDELRSYCVQKDPSFFCNKDADFTKSIRIYEEKKKQKIRAFSKSIFHRKLHNGEIVEREWLSYSPSTGCIYCLICRLFSKERNQFSLFGFNDWKHPERIVDHEESKAHKLCLTAYAKRRKKYWSY